MAEDDRRNLPAEIWPALASRLWHATNIDAALAIVSDGAIRPDAPSKYINGYCRSLGGISLFDFREPMANLVKAMDCGWPMWLRGHGEDGEDEIGVWFEIQPAEIIPHIPALQIHAHWHANRKFDEQGRLRFRDPMPYCEACYIGGIPLEAINGALLIDGRRLADCGYVANDGNMSDAISQFRAAVRAKPPLPPTIADKLRDARRRSEAKWRADNNTGGAGQ